MLKFQNCSKIDLENCGKENPSVCIETPKWYGKQAFKLDQNCIWKKAYFSDRRLSKEDIQLLFALRTKMIDCKSNFSKQNDNVLTCRFRQELNSMENEDQLLLCKTLNWPEHLLLCKTLNTNSQQKLGFHSTTKNGDFIPNFLQFTAIRSFLIILQITLRFFIKQMRSNCIFAFLVEIVGKPKLTTIF